MDQSYLIRNPNTYVFELLFSIIVALVTFIFSQKIKPKYSLSIFFGSLATVILIGFSVFLFRSELVDISYPIFMLTITFLTGLYFRFIEENRIAIANLQKEAKLLKESFEDCYKKAANELDNPDEEIPSPEVIALYIEDLPEDEQTKALAIVNDWFDNLED